MPTREQDEAAIALAQREGNERAVEALIKRASAEHGEEGSFIERLGSGMQDVITGSKQALGLAQPGEVEEHMRLADRAGGGKLNIARGLGTAAMLAPALAIPGANTVAGAAAIGAGSGALMPTDDPNVIAGKAKSALIGGLTGGGVQYGLNVAGPAIGHALTQTMGSMRDAASRLTQGGRQRLAERDFMGLIDDPVAAENRLGAYQAARTAQPIPPGMSGAPQTTGVVLGNRPMMEGERFAREATGRLGEPFRNVSEQARNTQWNYLQRELSANVPRLAQDAQDVYANFIRNARLVHPFDPANRLLGTIAGAQNRTTSPTIRAELERLGAQVDEAIQTGNIQLLHDLRMTGIDTMINRSIATEGNAINRIVNREATALKSIFDTEMDAALGGNGQWFQFLDDYTAAATARSQGQAGNALLQRMETLNDAPGTQAPNLLGQRRMLAREAQEMNPHYENQPLYSPAQQDALLAVRREIGNELQPYELGPRGTATARNLNPENMVLGRAVEAQQRLNRPIFNTTMEVVGSLAGGPGVVTGARGIQRGIDRQTIDIAQRLVQLYADPNQALAVLQRMNLPPGVVRQVAQIIMQDARRLGSAGARALPNALAAMAAQPQ